MESDTTTHQRPDGTPKNTGRDLHESVVTVRVDDDAARSNYTIHVEHPDESGGVACYHRTSREMVVSGLRSHLGQLADSDIARVDVIDEAGLDLDEPEVRPESYDRAGAFAPDTPEIEVSA